jgi:hypothetical protein
MVARNQARTKRDLIIEVWESLDCESVGARELEEIQRAVSKKFGAGAVESPASIARTLADEGAALRHPEVMECDARWREQNSHELLFQETLNFDGLTESVASIQRLERLRMEFGHASNHEGLRRLTEAVQSSKEECRLLAKSPIVEAGKRAEASEIAQWLGVWLKQPEIFADWIELRKRSGEFVERFGDTFS